LKEDVRKRGMVKKSTKRKRVYVLIIILLFLIATLTIFYYTNIKKSNNVLFSPQTQVQKDEFGDIISSTIYKEKETSFSRFIKNNFQDKDVITGEINETINKTFIAEPSNILPVIDGEINSGEWEDAFIKQVKTTANKNLTIYTKTYHLKDQNNVLCSIYPSNPSYKLPCGKYLLMAFEGEALERPSSFALFFDEGNDGWRGSGSYDNFLGFKQEDYKEITGFMGGWSSETCQTIFDAHQGCPEPNCAPWMGEDCWMCGNLSGGAGDYCYLKSNQNITHTIIPGDRLSSPFDGYHDRNCGSFPECWIGIGVGSPEWERDRSFFGFAKNNTVEVMIPFHGLEIDNNSECEEECDLSDITFNYGNSLKFLVFSYGGFPKGDLWDSSVWAILYIKPPTTLPEEEKLT